MFGNIGKTIKVMAKVFFWLGTITIVGVLAIWPFAFVLYGFGELVEKQTQIAKKMGDVSKNQTRTELKDELPEI